MSGVENIAVVNRLFDALESVDFVEVRDRLQATRGTDPTDIAALAESFGELGRVLLESIDPDVEIDLTRGPTPFIAGNRFSGWDGWLSFWREWLEPWEGYSVRGSDWTAVGDHVFVEADVSVMGRGAEIPVDVARFQVWTLHGGKVVRFTLYPSREEAFTAMEGDRG